MEEDQIAGIVVAIIVIILIVVISVVVTTIHKNKDNVHTTEHGEKNTTSSAAANTKVIMPHNITYPNKVIASEPKLDEHSKAIIKKNESLLKIAQDQLDRTLKSRGLIKALYDRYNFIRTLNTNMIPAGDPTNAMAQIKKNLAYYDSRAPFIDNIIKKFRSMINGVKIHDVLTNGIKDYSEVAQRNSSNINYYIGMLHDNIKHLDILATSFGEFPEIVQELRGLMYLHTEIAKIWAV